MSKHSQGPWVAHKADSLHGYDHFVMTPRGFLGYLPKESEGGGMQLFTEDEARLIAAAPDLLEALKVASAMLHGLPKSLGYEFDCRQFDAAIRKATGESE